MKVAAHTRQAATGGACVSMKFSTTDRLGANDRCLTERICCGIPTGFLPLPVSRQINHRLFFVRRAVRVIGKRGERNEIGVARAPEQLC